MEILWIFSLFLVLGNVQEIMSFRKFWRGRRFEAEPVLLGDGEDLWFDQQLDHFDPTISKTWKQVILSLSSWTSREFQETSYFSRDIL